MAQNTHIEQVPVDISRIKSKAAFNMTQRQIVCFAIAGLVGFPVFFTTRIVVGNDLALLFMGIVMAPFFVLAIYERDGYTAEQLFYLKFRHEYLLPGVRPYQTSNLLNTEKNTMRPMTIRKKEGGKSSVQAKKKKRKKRA